MKNKANFTGRKKKNIVILGAGTAGSMMVNKLSKQLNSDEWKMTLVDMDKIHYYQPGFLFIPFGTYDKKDVIKPKKQFLPKSADIIYTEISKILPETSEVVLKNKQVLPYDILIIATGSKIAPEETEGMLGDLWMKKVFNFYTLEGSIALSIFLEKWEGGKMVVNITEMPIKCPVAPLEFVFLADSYFTKKGIRDKVEIEFVTPLPEAFTKPKAAEILGDILEKKNIKLITDFNTGKIDNENQKLVSWDERDVPFDLLVTVPVNKGSDVIERSGLGDELNFVPTDKHTLQSKAYSNVFVIGDATDLPSSKAGSVAHFEAEILTKNILNFIDGKELTSKFDGHANCYIESGYDKAFLIDFNYETEPLPGKFTIPGIGPFSLLEESKINHFGKMAFKWLYWNFLIKGRELPVSSNMSLAGKTDIPENLKKTAVLEGDI
ncbi:NAD(P)/FAD-dependent oxidoreductase [candidate division KSB1 bacterium]|nr:NAD(P)/FAD-dependent oxidoreductase [candidate division KSB1 bacterium]